MNRLTFLLCALLASLGSVFAQDTGIRVAALPQQVLSVEAGQYSGIAYVGGDRYAVVDDKLPGGGIVFFELPLREDGSVRTARVRRTVPEGTRTSAVSGLDNEGVVYAGGKLFVSAEGDQSVREYDLDGYPTGRSLAVPEALGTAAIVPNGGFEALAWSAATGCFWTTTEFPLQADGKPSRRHRLQRFNADLQPAGQAVYQTDEPRCSDAQAASAMAYVFGIAAMAALDDGRLIVLEREVYVPRGRPKEILAAAFTQVKLYLVDPSAGGGTLPKQLLYAFETRLSLKASGIDVALANYEGMCLGPHLADGRQTLVLIADSQSGVAGLAKRIGRRRITFETIKVLLIGGS